MAPPLGPQMCGPGQAWAHNGICVFAGEIQVGTARGTGRSGSLPKLGSYSLINLLVRNFTVRAARRRSWFSLPIVSGCWALEPSPLILGRTYLASVTPLLSGELGNWFERLRGNQKYGEPCPSRLHSGIFFGGGWRREKK